MHPDAIWCDLKLCGLVSIAVEDIRIIASCNSQVGLLKETLGEQFLISMVDKLQGKGAPVIVYFEKAIFVEETLEGWTFYSAQTEWM